MSYSKVRFDNYILLSEKYIDLLNGLIDYSLNKNLLPLKYMLAVPIIKNYIINNKASLIENGVKYVLEYKDEITNFSLSKLDDINYDDDNISNIYQLKDIINEKYDDYNNQNQILDIIIEIKNNAKKLIDDDIDIIKNYVELIIMILEKLKYLFTN